MEDKAQKLYELHQEALEAWGAAESEPKSWSQLGPEERGVWEYMADRLD